MAPPPPPITSPATVEFDALKSALLDAEQHALVGITAALKGAGGFGKTSLAARRCARTLTIKETYHDGILWLTLGETPG